MSNPVDNNDIQSRYPSPLETEKDERLMELAFRASEKAAELIRRQNPSRFNVDEVSRLIQQIARLDFVSIEENSNPILSSNGSVKDRPQNSTLFMNRDREDFPQNSNSFLNGDIESISRSSISCLSGNIEGRLPQNSTLFLNRDEEDPYSYSSLNDDAEGPCAKKRRK